MFDMKYDKNGQPIKNTDMESNKNIATQGEGLPSVPTQTEGNSNLQSADTQSADTQSADTQSADTQNEEGFLTNESSDENMETTTKVPPAPSQGSQDDIASQNFRNLREAKEKVERERDELVNYLKSLQANKEQVQEEDLNFEIDPDALAEGKHLSKVNKRMQKQEQKLKAYEKQLRELAVESRLKSQFPDFENVVTEANLAKLTKEDPELVDTLQASTDLYKKAVVAYRNIKRYGIYQSKTYKKEKEVVEKNSNKPRPVTSVSPQQGSGPLSQANAFADGLTEDLKRKLYTEMMNSIKKG